VGQREDIGKFDERLYILILIEKESLHFEDIKRMNYLSLKIENAIAFSSLHSFYIYRYFVNIC